MLEEKPSYVQETDKYFSELLQTPRSSPPERPLPPARTHGRWSLSEDQAYLNALGAIDL